MASNFMKVYVNKTGNVIRKVNLTCTQNSSENYLQVYPEFDCEYMSVVFTQPDGHSEKHFMTMQYDLEDKLYGEYLLPSSLTSFLMGGNTAYLTFAVQGFYYDDDHILKETNVINEQITVLYSDNTDVLDRSYNKTDVENLWYSVGVINQSLGIGTENSYASKVSITQKINNIPYGTGNITLYGDNIPLSSTNLTPISTYFKTITDTTNTLLAQLDTGLSNGTYVVNRAYSDHRGNNIYNTYVSNNNLIANYYDKTSMNTLLNAKMDTSTALDTFYTKSQVDTKLANVYKIKGSVATADRLPVLGNTAGDVYNVVDSGINYVWNGTEWDPLGGIFDTSSMATKSYVDGQITIVQSNIDSLEQNTITALNSRYTKSDTYSKLEVNNLFTSHLANYYNQTEINNIVNTLNGSIADRANKADVYTKTQIDNTVDTINNTISLKANSADVYTKSSIDTTISGINTTLASKADANTVYTKTEIDNMIPEDINMSNYYTKDEVDDEISDTITGLNLSSYAPISYVDNRVAALVNQAPSTLDTLKELSDALGNDANFATTMTTSLAGKANSADVYTKSQVDGLIADVNNLNANNLLGYYTKQETEAYVADSLSDYYTGTVIEAKLSSNLTSAQTYINNRLSSLVGAAPSTLDTLEELASAFSTNASAITAINSAITNKANSSDVYLKTQTYSKSEVNDLIQNVPQVSFVFRDYITEEV